MSEAAPGFRQLNARFSHKQVRTTKEKHQKTANSILTTALVDYTSTRAGGCIQLV